jgi:hypothetical protein
MLQSYFIALLFIIDQSSHSFWLFYKIFFLLPHKFDNEKEAKVLNCARLSVIISNVKIFVKLEGG